MINNDMTAEKAHALLLAVLPAIQYLDRVAQDNDNAEGDIIARTRLAKEDVDLSRGALSWKTHKKVSKAEQAAQNALKYAELVMTHEAKAKAIETSASRGDVKRITKETVKA